METAVQNHSEEALGKSLIHVFVNKRKIDLEENEITGEQLLREAGFAGNDWDLLRLQGEGDPTGGQVIMSHETIHVKDGEHFRVIPGNRTFGGSF
jgi:hypothetical protein